MPTTRKPKVAPPAPEFTRTRDYLSRFVVADDAAMDVLTVWILHTHLFSPSCETPPTTPYLYISGDKGCGKSTLGEVAATVVRAPLSTVGITGAGLVRLVGGSEDEESDLAPMPTLFIDEVDALYSGSKEELLRMMLNAGYRKGGVVPRAVGTKVINYSAFCPKFLMGIDNGHLPDTVADRAIRIDLRRATREEMANVEMFFHYEVEDDAAELNQELSHWAQENSLAIRQYKPAPVPEIAKTPRHWEIARTLVQVAHVLNVEDRIVDALVALFKRNRSKETQGMRAIRVMREMFEAEATAKRYHDNGDRIPAQAVLQAVLAAGVIVPGGSFKGLGGILSAEGINGDTIRLRKGHPEAGKDDGPIKGFYLDKSGLADKFREMDAAEAQ